MTKFQNSKHTLVIEYWNLRFVCNLVLGVWDFIHLYQESHGALIWPSEPDPGF